MNLKKIFLGTIVSLALISCDDKAAQQDVVIPEYPVMALHKTDATLLKVYPAVVKGQEDVEIRPRIDGWIKNIYVDEGAKVQAGQRLFDIDSPAAEEAYRTATAEVKSAEAQVKTAELDVNRFRPLAEKGIVSTVQLNTYENIYETAKARLEQAKASLFNANALIQWSRVTSPVSGIVGELPYRKGNLVNSANVLTTVANTSRVYAYFTVNEKEFMSLLDKTEGENQAAKIKNLPPVELVLASGNIYPEKGKIETISGNISVGTGTVNFRAEFPNTDGMLRSGLSGRVRMPEIVKDVFVIPQEAAFGLQDKTIVYRLQGDTAVTQRLIEVLPMPDGKSYAVTGGLELGDKIVRTNIATLTDQMKITPVTE